MLVGFLGACRGGPPRTAQVEGAAPRSGFRRLDLAGLAEAVPEADLPNAETAGWRMQVLLAAGADIDGDAGPVTQVLSSLVWNALCHTRPGTGIALAVAVSPRAARAREPGALPLATA